MGHRRISTAGQTDSSSRLITRRRSLVSGVRKRKTPNVVVDNTIAKFMMNKAVVDWDGVPTYMDNFTNRKQHGSLGELCGSILGGNGFEELQYIIGKSQMSFGQHSIFILNRITEMMSHPLTFEEMVGDRKLKDCNEVWTNLFDANIRRLDDIYNAAEHDGGEMATFMFDEMDKSMDILNVTYLYGEVLPHLVEKYNIQIIIVSHSPIILTENVMKNPLYNIISVDEEYTQKCLNMLKGFSYGK